MADASKREKLSAAKRKLKEFKQKSHAKVAEDADDNVADIDKINAALNGNVINGHKQEQTQQINNDINEQNKHASTNNSTSDATSTIVSNKASENISQLSRQINGLITNSVLADKSPRSDQDHVVHPHIANTVELEKNRELTSLVEQYLRTNDHLTKQLNESKSQIQRLQHTLESDRLAFDERLKRELGTLREQLQVHIQTIGILVAEKTELQSTLNQSQRSSEQLMGERDELQGRLKASRQRVAELEKNLGSAVSTNQKQDKANKEMSKDVDRLKLELYKLNKSNEEFQQQISELHGKLQKRNLEFGKLEDELIELRGKLEMSNLHLQQLQAGGDKQYANNQLVEQLTLEKTNLQTRLSQADEIVQRLTRDKEQAIAQYQAYVEQMQVQSRNLQAQVSTLLNDKEHVLAQRRELEQVVSELQGKKASVEAEAHEAIALKQNLTDSVSRLKEELERLTQLYNAQVVDNGQLSRLVSEQEAMLEQQHDELQRLADSQVDHSKLLESMQSDKTALSRATAQNRELKNQLTELQNGFVKMSNENMELLTKLQSEQHVVKELSTRLTQQEEELEEIRHVLAKKEHELQAAILNDANRPRQVSVSESDYEGHALDSSSAPFVEILRRELATSQDTINSLTRQNAELRAHLVDHGHHSSVPPSSDKQLESLSTSVRQLEMERNEVMSQLKSEQRLRHETQQKVIALQQQLETQVPATLDGHIVSKTQFEALHHAMSQLEEKYMRVMRDKADLMERLEATEHQLLQLQGETDTIGEYVSLYQTQRNALRQRQIQNDEYIAKMSREREDMQDKLRTLQALVVRLLSEKSQSSAISASPALNSSIPQGSVNSELAKEQARANKLLNSIAVTAPQEDWPNYSSSSDDDESEVDGINKHHKKHSKKLPPLQQSTPIAVTQHEELVDNVSDKQTDLSVTNDTAQQIIHLLNEMGRSNPEKTYAEFSVLQCANCQGPLIHL